MKSGISYIAQIDKRIDSGAEKLCYLRNDKWTTYNNASGGVGGIMLLSDGQKKISANIIAELLGKPSLIEKIENYGVPNKIAERVFSKLNEKKKLVGNYLASRNINLQSLTEELCGQIEGCNECKDAELYVAAYPPNLSKYLINPHSD